MPEEKKIGILIPVYENSDLLEGLLEELMNDSREDKKIFVIIDEPNENSLKVAKKCQNKVNFVLNKQRKGKVDALNSAVKISKGEILVFLDSDVKLGNSKDFLRVIAEEMEEADILDVKKKIIRDSFIPKMVN